MQWMRRKYNSLQVKIAAKIIGKMATIEIRDSNADGVRTLEIINRSKRISIGKWEIVAEKECQSAISLTILKAY